MIKSLVFDFDNTIAKNVEPTDSLILDIVMKYNPHVDKKQLLAIIQDATTDCEICKKLVPAENIESVYSEILRFNLENAEKVFYSPEVLKLISALKIDYQLNIISGRDSFSLIYSLKKYGIESFFEEIIGGNSGFEVKPSPESLNYIVEKYNFNLSEVVFVGDSMTDYLTAKAAGCHFIHISWYNKEFSNDEIISCRNPFSFMDILMSF
jgi:HAD superfamily hydrolase (TIGR01509 family)